MARIILLDSGPLWLACYPPGSNPAVDQCHAWLITLEASPAGLFIPAISDYEVRRALLRRGARAKLRRLDALRARFGLIAISVAALDHAAGLWSLVCQHGRPTAEDLKLDADCIVAGQSLTIGGLGDTVTIATNNVKHFGRFPGIDSREWWSITS